MADRLLLVLDVQNVCMYVGVEVQMGFIHMDVQSHISKWGQNMKH